MKNLYLYRRILWDMAKIQLKSKYAGSKLGIWWAVVIPLILAGSIDFVFTKIYNIKISHYSLFVLAGIIPWLFFCNALTEATNSFFDSKQLLRQNIFPREFIPISSVLSNFLNFLIGLIFLLPLFLIFNFKIIACLGFLLIVILCNFVFVVGLGILFSSINVFFRDLNHFLSISFMAWFWVTPIFYSLDMLPPSFRWVCLVNPLTHYVTAYREILFKAEALSFFTVFILFLISFISFISGYLFFIKKEQNLLKKI